jgi:DNA-directed RNA polymerase subunit H
MAKEKATGTKEVPSVSGREVQESREMQTQASRKQKKEKGAKVDVLAETAAEEKPTQVDAAVETDVKIQAAKADGADQPIKGAPTFNVLVHSFVPYHEVLDEKETQAVLKEYGVSKEQLPKIRSTDACIKALSAMERRPIKEGSVIRITRKSETADKAVSYRLVIRG